MSIHRIEEYYKYHLINSDEALEYGLEAACILGNINKFPCVSVKDIHKKFPYIEYVKFYEAFDKLLELELIKEIED